MRSLGEFRVNLYRRTPPTGDQHAPPLVVLLCSIVQQRDTVFLYGIVLPTRTIKKHELDL